MRGKRFWQRAALVLVLGVAATAAPPIVRADDDNIGDMGLSFGPRASYFKPNDGDGAWSGGAQLRWFPSEAIALEGSIDYRQEELGETDVDLYPVQASLLGFIVPKKPVSVYVLAGAGWYFTRIDPPVGDDDTDDRLGWHAGGGLEIALNDRWGLDGSYRYIWLEEIESMDQNFSDKDFDDSGSQVTIALNYHF